MSDPRIHGINRFVPASKLLDCIGETISDIKTETGLTWADIGEIMHKSSDRAALYGAGASEMGVIAYLRLKQQFGARFAGPVNALLLGGAASLDSKQLAQGAVHLTRFTGELQQMLLDGEISDDEVIAASALIAEANATMSAVNHRLAEALARKSAERGG